MLHLVLITINNKPIGCLHCPNRNTGETGDIDGRKIFQTSKNQSYQISSKFTYFFSVDSPSMASVQIEALELAEGKTRPGSIRFEIKKEKVKNKFVRGCDELIHKI